MTSSREMVIREDHDGMTWVMLLVATSRRHLSRQVKSRNWSQSTGCGRDCTGLIFMGSCTLLRAYRVGNKWIGVVECSEARDV